MTDMKGIKGVFFDLHGTLLLSPDLAAAWEAWHEAFHKCMTDCGLAMSKEEFTQHTERLFDGPEPEIEHAGMSLFERRVKDLCGSLGLDVNREYVLWMVEHIIGVWYEDMYLDPETHDVLNELGSRFRLAMITNWDHASKIPELLSDLEIDHYFEEVVISDEVGVAKPDPRIFHIALEKTGLQPSEVAYVGDSVEDIQGSQAAGVHTVLIRREQQWETWGNNSDLDSILRVYESREGAGVTVIKSLKELLSLF